MESDNLTSPVEYEIRPMTPDNRNGVLDVLSAAFGGGFDSRWFEWKHEAGTLGKVAWLGSSR